MKTIKRDQLESVALNDFWTEASHIGLKPGEWPKEIAVREFPGAIFTREDQETWDDQLVAVHYAEPFSGATLTIFND